jgi:REP-associated tyrosine transposase
MPDHVHLLAEANIASANLTTFVARWKQVTGFRFRSLRRESLWQSGFFDRILREEESSRIVARYILENPVRAGLTIAPSEYPHAHCVWTADPGFWD